MPIWSPLKDELNVEPCEWRKASVIIGSNKISKVCFFLNIIIFY